MDKNQNFENKDLVVGIIYRHPGHHFQQFRDKLCENIYKINMSKCNYIITGDMNINVLKYNLTTNITDYVNALNSVGCNHCVDKPTRTAQFTRPTCIDHVYILI